MNQKFCNILVTFALFFKLQQKQSSILSRGHCAAPSETTFLPLRETYDGCDISLIPLSSESLFQKLVAIENIAKLLTRSCVCLFLSFSQGVIVKLLVCGIMSKFKLQSCYNIHFWKSKNQIMG